MNVGELKSVRGVGGVGVVVAVGLRKDRGRELSEMRLTSERKCWLGKSSEGRGLLAK